MDTVVDIFIPNSTRSKFDRDFLIKKCKENGIRLDSISEIEKLNEFGLPNVGDKVNGGGILAAFIEELDPNSSVLARLNKLSSKSQLSRASVRKVPYSVMDGVITRIDVTINPKANYLDKIRTHYEEQVRKEDAKLREFLGDREVVRNIDVDFNRFSGVIRIYIRYEDVPEVGDKFSNLFGSKGTITKILEDDEMPLSKATGLPYDAIFGPDSTWSRKNPSQVKEAYLGLAAVESKKLGTQYIANGEFGKLRELLNALHVTKKYNDYSDQELIDYDKSQDRFYVVYADFMDNKYTKEALERIEQVTGVSMENKEIVYIPEERTYSRIPIVHGYNSMLRLHFKAADKARATSAIYTGDDLVIGRGKYRGGGQQLGEMEIWSLLSNNTVEVYEHLTGRDVTTQSTQSIQNAMFLMGLVLQPDEVLSTGNSDSESEE
jgi:DNA-directed RNA polymerase beta subunit